MSNHSENNKRIAKNTMILYFRMFVMMLIGLFTSRVLFNALGDVDYGLYNVVGGVVILFIFLNNAMSTASSRFITYELGSENKEHLFRVFGMSIVLHAIISLVIIILAETIGLWFLYNKMQIPDDRFYASIWVYHLSVFSVALSVMSVPYNSAIIAHEKISAFAYMSIFDAIMKLFIAYVVLISSHDKLIIYATLIFLTQVIRQIIYMWYSFVKFEEVRQKVIWDKNILNKMFSFASWTLLGNISVIANTHGQNVLLNLFGGPSVNAARAVSVSVQSYLSQFSQNFQTALNPQITKNYAIDNNNYIYKLINSSAKFSYYLLFIPALPILVETKPMLILWLKHIPEYTVMFTKLIIITSIINALSDPLTVAVQATGKVKKFEIIIGGLLLLVLPLSYLSLKIGLPLELPFWIYLLLSFITLIARTFIANEAMGLPILPFLNEALLYPILVSLIPISFTVLLHYVLSETLITLILICVSSVIISTISIYLLGLSKSERGLVNSKIPFLKNKVKAA